MPESTTRKPAQHKASSPRPVHPAIYARISQDTAGNEIGVSNQQQACERLAAQLGWPAPVLYVDNDISAYDRMKVRKEYQRLLKDIASGLVDGLLIWDPDRLHRRTLELGTFIALVENHPIAIATVNAGTYDLTTPAGRMQSRILAAVAEHESEQKSSRILLRKASDAEEGLPHHTGIRPFGFVRDTATNELRIHPEEAAIIREVRDRIMNGATVYSIVRDLQNRGVVGTKGKPFSSVTLKQVMTRASIAGVREHVRQGRRTGEPAPQFPGTWEAIITQKELTALRSTLNARTEAFKLSSPHSQRPWQATRLLTGLLTCGRCGKWMNATAQANKSNYACVKGGNPNHAGCGNVMIRGDYTEEVVIAYLFEALKRSEPAKATSPKKADRLLTEIAQLEADRAELTRRLTARDLNTEEWEVLRAPIMERLAAANAELGHAGTVTHQIDFTRVEERWPDLSFDDRRTIIGAVFESITIMPFDRQKPRVFDPTRVVPVSRARISATT